MNRIPLLLSAAMVLYASIASSAFAQTVTIEETIPVPLAEPSPETTGSIGAIGQHQTEIRRILVETAPEPVVVDFDVKTGVVVPERAALWPLPPRVIELVPEYEGYEYFVLEDNRIVIVESASSQVVYVIP